MGLEWQFFSIRLRFVPFKDANSDPAILSLTRAGQLSLVLNKDS